MSKTWQNIKAVYAFSNTWTGTFIVVLLAIFFFAQAFVIPTGSMKNTLLEGDFLIVKKFSYGIPTPHIPLLEIPVLPDFDGDGHILRGDMPKRGDIVVFRFPKEPKIHYVKRLFALGGDKVAVRGKTTLLRPHEGDEFIKSHYPKEKIIDIDGELWVKNPYKDKHPGINNSDLVQNSIYAQAQFKDFGPIIVEKNRFFMMGDNRDYSFDSRFWGSVEYKYIVGKPWFVYFSWESRPYEDVAKDKELLASDVQALTRVCGEIDIFSKKCEDLWNTNRYRVRWQRIAKSPSSLEENLKNK